MRRREFLGVLGGAAAAWPAAARAQRVAVRRLGVLSLGVPAQDFSKSNTAAFLQGLSTLGWKEGANLAIDWRWYGTDTTLAERQAAEIVAMKPDAIFAASNPALEKVRPQTKSIPVVFCLISDPVGMGYVDSLARPGGNLTGFMTYDPPIYTKQLQMLTQITPPARTVAVLYNPQTGTYASRMLAAIEPAARSMGVTLRDAPCHDDADIEAARSAVYVDRVLRGEKPRDLPVQAPSKFKLTINLKTAKALNVTITSSLLGIADEVIE